MIRHDASYPDTPRAEDWRDEAVCRTADPELWFASEQTNEGKATLGWARAICLSCPVMFECGEWAYTTRQAYGMWGGVSEAERRQRLRRRGIKLPAPETAESAA